MSDRVLHISDDIRWVDFSELKVIGFANPIPSSGEVLEERDKTGTVSLYEFDTVKPGSKPGTFAAKVIYRGIKDTSRKPRKKQEPQKPTGKPEEPQLGFLFRAAVPPVLPVRPAYHYARPTSREAFLQIRNSNLISKMQAVVLDILFEHPCITQQEAWYLRPEDLSCAVRTLGTRFAELKSLGVVTEAGKRTCKYSKRTCYVWDLTGRHPEQPIERQSLREQVDLLRKQNEELRRQIDAKDKMIFELENQLNNKV